MTGTTYSSTFDYPRPVQGGRDASWYGRQLGHGHRSRREIVLQSPERRDEVIAEQELHPGEPGRQPGVAVLQAGEERDGPVVRRA